MHISECCGSRLTHYDEKWKDGICSKCKHHSPELVKENKCYKCDAIIDPEDTICCNCIDNTEGRNQHFWQIKRESK